MERLLLVQVFLFSLSAWPGRRDSGTRLNKMGGTLQVSATTGLVVRQPPERKKHQCNESSRGGSFSKMKLRVGNLDYSTQGPKVYCRQPTLPIPFRAFHVYSNPT
ncbi:hypothetical protein F5Y14DRAFT_417814 [Nemania sp. NC0429]|nr:hypothetical protein F5Y14DRAFT_417814 [Nemania sp. NC0429]